MERISQRFNGQLERNETHVSGFRVLEYVSVGVSDAPASTGSKLSRNMIVQLEEPPVRPASRTTWRHRLGITALFTGLTALMTWPQALVFGTHAADHHDIFFNLWRFSWIAHTLLRSPLNLFNGNVFYPERGVLAYSDATLLEGIIAAPLLLAGLPPMMVHNCLLLGAIVASGAGMFAFARQQTGSQTAAMLAGIVFAFAPYRFEHYMHMELQWTVWVPWAFFWLQRTIETPTVKAGVLTGVFVALQMLSSIYYGIFLALLLAAVALLQIVALPWRRSLQCLRVLAIGGLIAGAVSLAYSRPYTEASRLVGTRSRLEVAMFSAQPRDYKVASETNYLYGEQYPGRGERRLFPGVLPLLLALAGLLLIPHTPATVAYLVGLVLAFELSLGVYGVVYPFLYDHVSAFRGLRAPARISVFGLFFLGVLAARGAAALATLARPAVRQAVTVLFCAIIVLEYWVAPLPLIRYPNNPPALYKWLATQPRGIVVEFPMLHPSVPGYESRYAYMSTFHWMPLLNGYSGYFPPAYMRRLHLLAEQFPDAESVAQLRADGVRYIIVHSGGYSPKERHHIVSTLIRDHGLALVADFEDGWGEGAVFVLP
ncbi:MAG: hypothetical protein ACREUZ_14480 [Burkholderiales bacterium]